MSIIQQALIMLISITNYLEKIYPEYGIAPEPHPFQQFESATARLTDDDARFMLSSWVSNSIGRLSGTDGPKLYQMTIDRGAAGVAHVLTLPNLKARVYVLKEAASGISGPDPAYSKKRWVVPPKSWLDPLIAQLATDEPELIWTSARLLGCMEAHAKKALPAIEKLFESKDGSIVIESLCASIRIRGAMTDEHFGLMDRIVDKEPLSSKAKLFETLRKVSPIGEKYLWKVYKTHTDADVVELALVSLHRSLGGSTDLRDDFRDIAVDGRNKPQIRYLAMIGMRNTGKVTPEGIRTLIDVMLNDTSETVRAVAARELAFYPQHGELIVTWLENVHATCTVTAVKNEAKFSLSLLRDWKRIIVAIEKASNRARVQFSAH